MGSLSTSLCKKKLKNLPHGATTNIQLLQLTKKLKIPNFRGVFMRTNLPSKIRKNECGIVNLDHADGPGTHWVAYVKRDKNILYFDSYGNLRPPQELIRYFALNNVMYNHDKYQRDKSNNCGQLCLNFLRSNT